MFHFYLLGGVGYYGAPSNDGATGVATQGNNGGKKLPPFLAYLLH